MIARSLSRRAVAATLLTAGVSALVMAAGAVFSVRLFRERHDRLELGKSASLLARSLAVELAEREHGPDGAAREAILQTVGQGDHAVIRRGAALVAEAGRAPTAGPGGTPPPGWLVEHRRLPGGWSIELARKPEDGLPVQKLFWAAIVVAAIPSSLVGVAVGAWAGRAAARPIEELATRLGSIDGPGDFTVSPPGSLPSEAAVLERAFAAVLSRLRAALDREAEFARNAAHELRTPLTRIRLRTERAAERAPSECRAELASVTAEVDRLSRLVDALLVLARDETAGLEAGETVNLADLLRVSAAAGERPVAVDAPDEALVRGDEDLLRLAVDNLLDNARKYAAPGLVPAARLRAEGGEIRLVVETPGVVLGEEERERVFERFYRGPAAREAAPGHGLGLALARHVARVHRGDVVAGAGGEERTVFELRVPAWRGEV